MVSSQNLPSVADNDSIGIFFVEVTFGSRSKSSNTLEMHTMAHIAYGCVIPTLVYRFDQIQTVLCLPATE
jgi:hypothetical protein